MIADDSASLSAPESPSLRHSNEIITGTTVTCRHHRASAYPAAVDDQAIPVSPFSCHRDRATDVAVASPDRDGFRSLWLALLARAFDDCVLGVAPGATATEKVSMRTALAWVHGSGAGYPLSFDAICGALDLDADFVRERFARIRGAAARRAR
jgi:hypothetical protein